LELFEELAALQEAQEEVSKACWLQALKRLHL
jgi:hypothetical protein